MKLSSRTERTISEHRKFLTLIASGAALLPFAAASAGTVLVPGAGTAAGGGAVVAGGATNTASGQFSAVVGGSTNTASGGKSAVVAGSNNSSAGGNAVITGGSGNMISTLVSNSGIVSGSANDIGNGIRSTVGCFIGAGSSNSALGVNSGIVAGSGNSIIATTAFIGAGTGNLASGTSSAVVAGLNNVATGVAATVTGGSSTMASGSFATASGGSNNNASGISSTVAGGSNNSALGSQSAVLGGQRNEATGAWSAVIGGQDNEAGGFYSTVLGGKGNLARGHYSSAGGNGALTTGGTSFIYGSHVSNSGSGAVVFADATSSRLTRPINFSTSHQFVGVFQNGYRLHTNGDPIANPNVGVMLPSGATAWLSLSDRNSKTEFAEVDTVAVLEKVASMPMTTWKYKHDAETCYMGVMSQDLYDAFGLGQNDTTINSLVADGVQMAAIQGLNKKLEARDSEIDGLKSKHAELEAKLNRLEKLLK